MADITLADVVKRLRAEGDLSRNSGTHSIKSLKQILLDEQKATLDDKEDRREDRRNAEKQLELLSGLQGGGGSSGTDPVVSKSKGGKGGLLAGLAGGMLAGIGVGGGALAAGIGIMAAGGGYLLNEIGEMDAEAIKKKVVTLISIGDSFKDEGDWAFAKKGGAFAIAMTGIGAGLIAFSLGSGFASAVEYFTEGSTYAQSIKDNVKILMSISKEVAGEGSLASLAFVGKGATFLLAMTGIGAGLAVFGAGSAAAAAAAFISTEGWAKGIKDSVVTLMSIEEAVGGEKGASFIGKSARFLLAMTGISAGLVAFGFGSAVVTTSESLAKFTGQEDWAQKVKDNITTLMSIEDSLGGKGAAFGEAGTFLGIMTGIGAGLAAFGFGSAVVGISEGINYFTGVEGGNWAQTIKDNVKTLLSITDLGLDGDGEKSKAGMFASGLAKISAGLVLFGVGSFIGTLGNAGSAILEMFGAKSPFTQIMQVSKEADQLTKGAEALTKISEALDTFANIKISKVQLDFKDLALNLAEAIPFLTALATGGAIDVSWLPTGKTSFGPEGKGGLLNPDLRLDELSTAISKINYVLSGGKGTNPLTIKQIKKQAGATSVAISEAQIMADKAVASGAIPSTVITGNGSTDQSTTVTNSNTYINPKGGRSKMFEKFGPPNVQRLTPEAYYDLN